MPPPTPFDLEHLGRSAFGARVEYHESIGSTNDRAKLLAADPSSPTPLLILAGQQTAGRGRGQHRWWSAPGSLTFSLLLGPEALPDQLRLLPLWSLAAALAVVDALAGRLDRARLGLHWPNDVMADGRKISGILIEIAGPRRPVVGIGVNCNNTFHEAPDELRGRAASLKELTGQAHDQTGLLLDLLLALEKRLSEANQDPAQIAKQADRLCLDRGQLVTVEQGSLCVSGRCQGIGADGTLIVQTASGPRAVASGHCRKSGQ